MTSEMTDFVLVRVLGSELTNCLSLKENKKYYCGRDKNNNLSCNGTNVSAKHCVFRRYRNEVFVKDLNSNNGVFVNGIKIRPFLFKLRENDLIGIGTRRTNTQDSKKFIYRLKKQTQVVTESQSSQVLKRILESEVYHPSSKFCKFSDTDEKEHEKPSTSRQSPVILDTSGSDDNSDTNSNVILKKNDIKGAILNCTSDLKNNDEIIFDFDSDTITLSDYENLMDDDFHYEKDTFENEIEQIFDDDAKFAPVDLKDETDIEEELPFDKPKQNVEPIPVPITSVNSAPIITNTDSDDLSEATTISAHFLDNSRIMLIEDFLPNLKNLILTKTDLADLQYSHSSQSDTRKTEETATPVSDEKLFTSETVSDKLLHQILQWNPLNLEILSTEEECRTLKSYESHEQYFKVLKSHLICDIECIVKRSLEMIDSKQSPVKECTVVENSASKIQIAGAEQLSFLTFDLYLQVSTSLKVPTTGDLVHLKLSRVDINSSCAIIGYIKSVSSINSDRECSKINYTVITKILDLNIYMGTVLSLHVITGLLPSLNKVQAITDFQLSPLLPLILNPGIEKNLPPCDPLEKVILPPSSYMKSKMHILSSTQVRAVMEVSKVIRSKEPRISIIEGPPGTGKTTVLIDIISNVLSTSNQNISKPKILVCAKSRTEVDEIVSRLSFVKKKLAQGRDIKLVRISDPDIGDPEVQKFTSQVLAKCHIELGKREFLLGEESSKDVHEYQEKLSLLNSDFNKLEIASNSIKSYVVMTCFEILRSGGNVREMSEKENAKLMEFVENRILIEADVIACTLSMCLANKLDAVYRNKEQSFQACIIDEATQIPEIDLLKLLTYGAKSLVLLGDPFQRLIFEDFKGESNNPKITDDTLFSRIKANYKEFKNSPTFSLESQYRIYPNVVYWLNQTIYEGKMKCGLSAIKYPILPYRVLNFFPYSTCFDEPLFVSTLISCIVLFAKRNQLIKPMTIGVILPNDALKDNVTSAITSLSMSKESSDLFKIDVGTLCDFMNQERDVIIISCTEKLGKVEKQVEDECLYAAMTRVKHSLILYGIFRKNMKPSLLSSVVRTKVRKSCYSNIRDSKSILELQNYIIRKRF